MTTAEFSAIVSNWIATAKHPKTGRLLTGMTFQPMKELLACLLDNGFKNYTVSGGGTVFMRPWAEQVYGVPPECVIGSSIKTRVEMRDGPPVLVRLPEMDFINDKPGGSFGNIDFTFGNADQAPWHAGIGARFAPTLDRRVECELPFTVQDDGPGFVVFSAGKGLENIRRRVSELEARAALGARPRGGAIVEGALPWAGGSARA